MGGGASVGVGSNKFSIFLDEHLQQSSLQEDIGARKAFVRYIKGGTWYYLLPWEESSILRSATLGGSIDSTRDPRFISMERVGRANSRSPVLSDGGLIPEQNSRSNLNSPRDDAYLSDITNINTTSFNDDQMISFMFAVLFRVYFGSEEYKHWEQHGHDPNYQPYETSQSHQPNESDQNKTPSPRQASMRNKQSAPPPSTAEVLARQKGTPRMPLHDLFLIFSRKLSETNLLERLSTSEWLDCYINAIDHCPVGISIADADDRSNKTFPMLYGNCSFTDFVGGQAVADKMVRSKQPLMLCVAGAATPAETIEKFQAAMLLNKVVRLPVAAMNTTGSNAVTSEGRLLTLRPVNNNDGKNKYIIAVHSRSTATGPGTAVVEDDSHEQQLVEEVLMLLPLVMCEQKSGALRTRPSDAAVAHRRNSKNARAPLPSVAASNSGSNKDDRFIDLPWLPGQQQQQQKTT